MQQTTVLEADATRAADRGEALMPWDLAAGA